MLVAIIAAGCGPAEDGEVCRVEELPEPPSAVQLRPSGAAKAARPPIAAEKEALRIGLRLRSTADALAWTGEGALAVIDGRTGAVRSSVEGAGLGGVRDVAYDPWGKRAFVFEGDAQDGWGEISGHALIAGPLGPTLGPYVHLAFIDGEARLLASPLGVVVFEAGAYGARCKVLFDAGGPASSVALPSPASAWVEAGGAISLRTIHYEDGAIVRGSVPLKWKSIGAPSFESLGLAVGPESSARLVHAPARGGAILLAIEGSALSLRLAGGASPGPAAEVPLGAAGLRIEHAIALDDGAVVLALLSGQSRVVAVMTDEAGAIVGSDTLDLPGVVRQETTFFSHDLARLDDRRALAATSAGVVAIRVIREAGTVQLAIDPTFVGDALRGPVAAIDGDEP